MSISIVTSSSITVQWGPVNCIDRNGDNTGYIVQYTGSVSSLTKPVSGGTRMTSITGLMPSTNYSIEVAAVNGPLIGKYSDPRMVQTPPSKCYMCNN